MWETLFWIFLIAFFLGVGIFTVVKFLFKQGKKGVDRIKEKTGK